MEGIIVVNKPKGWTSRQVVNEVTKITGVKKIGHTGTLDPLATGVMVLCIGKATKIAELITGYDKEYVAEGILGIETDTLDIEGKILRENRIHNISKEKIKKVLTKFIGKINQEVPKYSAIKIKGRKLYEYARSDIEIELPKREIDIYSIKLLEDVMVYGEKLKFKIKCKVSKGTYIRSLIRDIGRELNTVATLSSLERVKQGDYTIAESYTIADVKNNDFCIITIKEALKNFPTFKVRKEIVKQVKNGVILDNTFFQSIFGLLNDGDELIALYKTYEKDPTKVKPYKMFI